MEVKDEIERAGYEEDPTSDVNHEQKDADNVHIESASPSSPTTANAHLPQLEPRVLDSVM